jgi:hypothetical protein
MAAAGPGRDDSAGKLLRLRIGTAARMHLTYP